jgi:hydroxymethylpyrimidine/phosphomethylpyrimidine kinase
VQADIGVDAVKVGMLGDVATVQAVAVALDALPGATPIVLDPVMVAESGAELLSADARTALIELLLPRAAVTTPNLPEALALVATARGDSHSDPVGEDAEALAYAVHALGPGAVVITGGHREQAIDVFFDGEQLVELPGERQPGGAAHGSGCTHSSIVAARLAWGDEPLAAARVAKELAARSVRDGLREIGAGSGPVDVIGLFGSRQ